MTLTVRMLNTIQEYETAGLLEAQIWGGATRETVPAAVMRAAALNGGLTAGAFEGDTLIGMSWAFTGVRGGRLILWSHMTGVHPTQQGHEIGFAIKQFQRTWALQRGFDEIRWTYDPLQRRNANFNLHRLGVTANLYHEDFYGQMKDGINPPVPSDRLEVVWSLKSPRVQSLASGQMQLPTHGVDPASRVLHINDQGTPLVNTAFTFTGDPCFAEIPSTLTGQGTEWVVAWRLALRQALQAAFGRGYAAVDFLPTQHGGAYILTRAL